MKGLLPCSLVNLEHLVTNDICAGQAMVYAPDKSTCVQHQKVPAIVVLIDLRSEMKRTQAGVLVPILQKQRSTEEFMACCSGSDSSSHSPRINMDARICDIVDQVSLLKHQ